MPQRPQPGPDLGTILPPREGPPHQRGGAARRRSPAHTPTRSLDTMIISNDLAASLHPIRMAGTMEKMLFSSRAPFLPDRTSAGLVSGPTRPVTNARPGGPLGDGRVQGPGHSTSLPRARADTLQTRLGGAIRGQCGPTSGISTGAKVLDETAAGGILQHCMTVFQR